jgi:hypothetical protein
MSTEVNSPLDFMRSLWGNLGVSVPGMVTPTFDIDELEKRIGDLKAVEGWLRMNLSMLQMTIQGLEMQKATLTAVKALGNVGQGPSEASTPAAQPLSQAVLWPWNLLQQIHEHLQEGKAPAPDQQGTDTNSKKRPPPTTV